MNKEEEKSEKQFLLAREYFSEQTINQMQLSPSFPGTLFRGPNIPPLSYQPTDTNVIRDNSNTGMSSYLLLGVPVVGLCLLVLVFFAYVKKQRQETNDASTVLEEAQPNGPKL